MYVEMLCILTKKKKERRIHSLNLKNIKNNMAIRNKKALFVLPKIKYLPWLRTDH